MIEPERMFIVVKSEADQYDAIFGCDKLGGPVTVTACRAFCPDQSKCPLCAAAADAVASGMLRIISAGHGPLN